MNPIDITLFPRFNLCINRLDNAFLLFFALRKFPQNTKSIDHPARSQLNATAIVPFLQYSYDICARYGSESRRRVDVDVSIFLGRFAEFLDGEGGG